MDTTARDILSILAERAEQAQQPPGRGAATLDLLDHPSSWNQLAERARDAGWPVSLPDTRLTAYRAATPEQRLAGVRHSTRILIGALVARCPDAPAAVARIHARLLAWADGGDEAIAAIRDDAASTADAAADADAAVYAAAFYASSYAGNAAFYAADDDAAWVSLTYICRLLDGP